MVILAMENARFGDFVRAYFSNWFALMSGGPSVPAAALAVYVENDTARALLWATAAASVVISAFLVWREERLKVVALDSVAGRESARLRIAEFITEGAGIRNEATDHYNPFTPAEWVGWSKRAINWHNAVLHKLVAVSPADAEWYRTLNEVPPPAIPMAEPPHGAEDEWLQMYAMHNYRLKKLEQLVSGEKGNLLVRK